MSSSICTAKAFCISHVMQPTLRFAVTLGLTCDTVIFTQYCLQDAWLLVRLTCNNSSLFALPLGPTTSRRCPGFKAILPSRNGRLVLRGSTNLQVQTGASDLTNNLHNRAGESQVCTAAAVRKWHALLGGGRGPVEIWMRMTLVPWST